MKAVDIKNLQEILKANANTYFDTKLSLKLAKLKLEVDNKIKIYNDVVSRLLNECAVLKDDGKYNVDEDGNLELKPDKKEMWETEITKIENMDLDILETFTDDEINQLKITPAQASTVLLLKENPKD